MIIIEREPSRVSALPARKTKRRTALKSCWQNIAVKMQPSCGFAHDPSVSQFKRAFMAARRSLGRTDGQTDGWMDGRKIQNARFRCAIPQQEESIFAIWKTGRSSRIAGG